MNILSRNYSDQLDFSSSSSSSSLEQVTSIGVGCAAALYFNYIRILVPHQREKTDEKTKICSSHHSTLLEHKNRIDSIQRDFDNDRIHRPTEIQSIFIRKWLFLFPATIENVARLIDDAICDENQFEIRLSIWKNS